jgi:hypothetical protein
VIIVRRPSVVEQPAEQQRSEKIAGRERQDVPSDLGWDRDAEEIGQHQREGEEDRVVEKRLRDHQHQSNHGTLAIGREQTSAHPSRSGVWSRIFNLIFGSAC